MSKYRNIDAPRLSDIFKALSNPNRLRIFLRLVSCCPTSPSFCKSSNLNACVGELGRNLDIVPSTLSHHIRQLQHAGLIKTKRAGQNIECSIEPDALNELAAVFSNLNKEANGGK
jgi:ArsR family transcriptional regulator